MKASRNLPKTGGGPKTPRRQEREGQGEEEGRKKEERQEEGDTGDKGMGKRGIILTSLL